MITTYFAVMLGGALGSGLRFWLAGCLAGKFHETIGTLAEEVGAPAATLLPPKDDDRIGMSIRLAPKCRGVNGYR